MKDIVIIGAGGFAREVAWLIEDINNKEQQWNLLGFIDDDKEKIGKQINGYKVLSNIETFKKFSQNTYCVIAIGDGKIRNSIVKKLNKDQKYATLIHPNVLCSSKVEIGEGSIICSGNIITVNIIIGKHNIINLGSTIGHDTILEDYVTVHPGNNISGNIKIKRNTILGTGSCIIQGKIIGKNCIIGAGSVIIKDIPDNCTVVGNPGKIIKGEENV